MEPEEPQEIERPRSVAEIIGEALDLYQRYPLLFLVLALGVIVPALRRSRELTREHYGHIFGLLLVTGLLNAGVLLGVRVIPLGSTAGAASVAVGIAARTITASFSALTLALLYFDLRARLTQKSPGGSKPEYAHLGDLD
ncbi:MAG: hypothetical protein ACRDLF_05995 [Solirubrobacteraceae bacterium]